MVKDARSEESKKHDQRKHDEELIDESVRDTFPASDPPAVGGTTKIGSGGQSSGRHKEADPGRGRTDETKSASGPSSGQ